MTEFIAYWNEMSGFTSLVLSMVSTVLVIVSILLSLYTARLPYKKKLIVSVYYNGQDSDGMSNVMTDIVNAGHVPIIITDIDLYDTHDRLITPMNRDETLNSIGVTEFIGTRCITLKPGENIRVNSKTDDAYLIKVSENLNNKVCLRIKDSDGKIRKFKNGFPVG